MATPSAGTSRRRAFAALIVGLLLIAVIVAGRLACRPFTGSPGNAVRLMEARLEEGRDRLLDLATSRVERRLKRFLLWLAQSMGRKTNLGVAIELALSGQDLAKLPITTPYTVSRILLDGGV
jgi:CRP-like cAMP-binding protein